MQPRFSTFRHFHGWMLHTSLLSASPSQFCVYLIFCQCALLCQEFTTIMILTLYYMSSLNKRPHFLLYMPYIYGAWGGVVVKVLRY
jgi:hypothetical protein